MLATLLKRGSGTGVFLSTWSQNVFWTSDVDSIYVLRLGEEFCESLQSSFFIENLLKPTSDLKWKYHGEKLASVQKVYSI